MFERYTADARQVMFLARYEASRLGSPRLEPEHLWLGLLRQNRRLVKRLAPKVSVESVEAKLTPADPAAERVSMTTELPLAAATRRALESASSGGDESRTPIKLDHLIMALLREENIPG